MTDIRRRCVFYISGFDPKGAKSYYNLYKQEATKQSQINGWQFDVGARQLMPEGNSFWTIESSQGCSYQVSTHYEFMRWDDVVRNNWPMHTLSIWWDVFTATLFNLRHGSWWKMFKLSWPPAVALFAPFVVLMLMLFGAPMFAVILGKGVVTALHWPVWAGGLFSLLTLALLLTAVRYSQSRFSMHWITRSYAFTARQAEGSVPELEARLDAQAHRLVERIIQSQDDEILIVAHSTGTIMAVCILSRAANLLMGKVPVNRALQVKLSFMSLGQCIPLLACLPQANKFRSELSMLGQIDMIDWIDFSAPPDGCCFAMCDPLAMTRQRPYRAPKLLSPKFADMFGPAKYRTIRKDKFRMHFQYLMASERLVAYDFFLITAANLSLAERYKHAASVNDFTGLRPFNSVSR